MNYACQVFNSMINLVQLVAIDPCLLWSCSNGVVCCRICLIHVHALSILVRVDMLVVLCLRRQHRDDVLPSQILTKSGIFYCNLPCLFKCVPASFWVCSKFMLVKYHVYFMSMLLVNMFECCSIYLPCSKVAMWLLTSACCYILFHVYLLARCSVLSVPYMKLVCFCMQNHNIMLFSFLE